MEAMDKKIAENLKNRLDSHDKLWYPVVTARLVKSNQSSSDSSEEMPATLFAEIRFLHSILLFIKRKAAYGLLRFPCAQRRRSGTASCAKKETKCGTHRLDHLCVPLFVCQAGWFPFEDGALRNAKASP
jgi:hypothetical protein